MNLGHTCLFTIGFCFVYFDNEEKKIVTLPHSAQQKRVFLGKIEQIPKTN